MDFPRKGNPKMRKLLFAMSALAALLMIAPSNGFAQDYVYQSMLGLYTNADDLTIVSATQGSGILFMYLILTNPYLNADLGEGESGTVPVDNLKGFDLKMILPAGFLLAGQTYPGNGLNIGSYPSFNVGFADPVPVVDGKVTLGTMTIFADGSANGEVFLQPTDANPDIPGFMPGNAYLEGGARESFKMFPISNAYDAPVFVFNGDAPVATESASWSGVKALYR